MDSILKTQRDIGIVGYGSYVPRYRLPAAAIAEVWKGRVDQAVLPVREKSVPGPDEDTVTMAIEAGQNALCRAGVSPQQIRAVWVGSESHPYAVKPSGTIVAEALGITPNVNAADFEFACKAGTEAMQAAFGFVGSGMGDYALAVAVDTAQGRPGDALEYTAAAGGAAFVIGPAEQSVAILEASYSYVTDTPDFFRRAHQLYPEHGHRFTGEPAYFHHIIQAARRLLDGLGRQPSDYAAAVFHQPNSKFPQKVAQELGFCNEQIRAGLLAPHIGNTYAGASPLGLTAVLDEAQPGQRILMVSFGSGAGSDAMSFIVSEHIEARRRLAPLTRMYLQREKTVNYTQYARWRKKIVLH
ncbi:MAG: hydroxymethylglutaryl-CoA synthase [Calditrichaeota bacterium]|nr:MAG: hydroxymethylglutaryl-CoA synthase [Calditrichota bacterium]